MIEVTKCDLTQSGKCDMGKMPGGLSAVMDVLLPRVCIVCGRRLNASEQHLCLYCRSEMPLTHFWESSHNAMADRFNGLIETGLRIGQETRLDVEVESEVSGLTAGFVGRPCERYAYAVALFFYDGSGEYRRITQRLKYGGDLSVGLEFGADLGRRIKMAPHFDDVDIVIPVPLHWTRKWMRGYNQAEVIAAEIAKVLEADMRTDVLERCRRTHTQTKVDPKKKVENVRGAFVADASSLLDGACHHLLLVDDVFTSGATLYNCFLALRAVFPVSVRISVATLAYVGGA